VLTERGEAGLDPGEAQAHLSLDVIQLGVDAPEYLGGQVFNVVSHGLCPCSGCLES
jgi:hypothetical protein